LVKKEAALQKKSNTESRDTTTGLSEERVREIAREEAIKFAGEMAAWSLGVEIEDARLIKESKEIVSTEHP
jgi:hypothetical protein